MALHKDIPGGEMSTEEEFQRWLKGHQGLLASDTSILHFESYQEILIERLRAAYFSGARSAVAT